MGLFSKLMFLRNYRKWKSEKDRIKYREEKFNRWSLSFRDKNPHYFKLFTLFYDQNIRIDPMMGLFDDLKKYKHLLYLLPRNVIHYENFHEIFTDLDICTTEYDELCQIPYVRKYFRNLNKEDQRKMVNLSLTYGGELFSKVLYNTKKMNGFIKFLKKYDLPLSDEFFIDRYNRRKNYIKSIKKNDCEVLHSHNNILILTVPNYKSMEVVGISSWCIKKKGDWKQHVNGKDTQLIIKDFNRVIDTTFGVTLTKKLKIKHIYDEDNDERYKRDVKKYIKLIRPKRKLKK